MNYICQMCIKFAYITYSGLHLQYTIHIGDVLLFLVFSPACVRACVRACPLHIFFFFNAKENFLTFQNYYSCFCADYDCISSLHLVGFFTLYNIYPRTPEPSEISCFMVQLKSSFELSIFFIYTSLQKASFGREKKPPSPNAVRGKRFFFLSFFPTVE